MTTKPWNAIAYDAISGARYMTMSHTSPPGTMHDLGTPVVFGWETLLRGVSEMLEKHAGHLTADQGVQQVIQPYDPSAVTQPGGVKVLPDNPSVLELENAQLRAKLHELSDEVESWKREAGRCQEVRERLERSGADLVAAREEVVRLQGVIGKLQKDNKRRR